jgi:hypothetical protein
MVVVVVVVVAVAAEVSKVSKNLKRELDIVLRINYVKIS